MRWFSFTLPASHWGVWTSFNYEWITSKTLLKLSHGYTQVNPAYNALLCGHRSKDFRAFGENVLDDIFYYLWEVQTMEVNPETARNARPLVIIKFLECSNKNDTLLVCACMHVWDVPHHTLICHRSCLARILRQGHQKMGKHQRHVFCDSFILDKTC